MNKFALVTVAGLPKNGATAFVEAEVNNGRIPASAEFKKHCQSEAGWSWNKEEIGVIETFRVVVEDSRLDPIEPEPLKIELVYGGARGGGKLTEVDKRQLEKAYQEKCTKPAGGYYARVMGELVFVQDGTTGTVELPTRTVDPYAEYAEVKAAFARGDMIEFDPEGGSGKWGEWTGPCPAWSSPPECYRVKKRECLPQKAWVTGFSVQTGSRFIESKLNVPVEQDGNVCLKLEGNHIVALCHVGQVLQRVVLPDAAKKMELHTRNE